MFGCKQPTGTYRLSEYNVADLEAQLREANHDARRLDARVQALKHDLAEEKLTAIGLRKVVDSTPPHVPPSNPLAKSPPPAETTLVATVAGVELHVIRTNPSIERAARDNVRHTMGDYQKPLHLVGTHNGVAVFACWTRRESA